MNTFAAPASRLTIRTFRFAVGGAALAATLDAHADPSGPVTYVLDTPLITDATVTTGIHQLATLDIATGATATFDSENGPEITSSSTLIVGFIGTVDSPDSKPIAIPLLVAPSTYGVDPDQVNAFQMLHTAQESGQILASFGLSTELPVSAFAAETSTVPGGFVLDETTSFATRQGFVAFSYITGASADPIYGWVEYAADAPSLSFAILAYGMDPSGAPITTPNSFTPYTAPAAVAIPEPSAAALAAALAAGSVALLQRRRRASHRPMAAAC
jgi:hypothetical protein